MVQSHIASQSKAKGVAPRVGVWIETNDKTTLQGFGLGRAPCGRVD